MINHKRTERIYREEGPALRRKRRRKGAAGSRLIMPSPKRTNQRWSMGFVTDSIVTGRRFRALAIVDDYSRECPAIEVDTSLGGRRVVGVLERLAEIRGLPDVITMDNGPEFAGRALDEWAYRQGAAVAFNAIQGRISGTLYNTAPQQDRLFLMTQKAIEIDLETRYFTCCYDTHVYMAVQAVLKSGGITVQSRDRNLATSMAYKTIFITQI